IMAICHYYQHRQRAREAAWLEIRGGYRRCGRALATRQSGGTKTAVAGHPQPFPSATQELLNAERQQ
ncbi:hypothetical protein OFB97_32195, partial [Escherichia coli]|nr:hypothetical protein [Escherichia coli]